jgi:uncharacterized repeat protein (TIGR03803 family)
MKMKLVMLLLLLSPVLSGAQTYTESILYSFGASSTDGTYPSSGLVMDSSGNLYGTTSTGGGSTNCSNGCGTVFKLNTTGSETILHTFADGSDGANPSASLTIDKSGNLYGTAVNGGLGYGTVFKVSRAQKFSTLHQFGRLSNDGLIPAGPLTLDSEGNVYGLTVSGGTNQECVYKAVGCGTVFEVTPKGTESILYNFTSETGTPVSSGNVLRDGKGDFYGVGASGDILFQVTSKGLESTLASGLNQGQGNYVTTGAIARNSAGNFYGSYTYYGDCGLDDCSVFSGLWEVKGSTNGVSYYLIGAKGCDPAFGCAQPFQPYGPLLFSSGTLYGTTNYGGTEDEGAVYEFNPSTGLFTTLYNFGVTSGAVVPEGGVIADSAGNLYGTTLGGGTYGYGTVFKLAKNN